MTTASLKQPKSLYYLFIAEMWERFSYYGMRAILVLYMTKVLLLGDTKSYLTYGAFTSLVYMTPVIGGWLADKYLGYVRAVVIGALFIICGHISLSLPFVNVFNSHFTFYLGLSLLIVGTGFFKANVSSIVATLYGKGDPRRDAGYTIFYMGINLGAFIASIAVAIVAKYFGWHAGFSLAAIGMLFGLIVFLTALKKNIFPKMANNVNFEKLNQKIFSIIKLNHLILILAILSVFAAMVLVTSPKIASILLTIFGLLVLLFILYQIAKSSKEERAGIILILILSFISMFFWSFFEQAGSSMNLFTDRNVNRTIFNFVIPTGAFQSLNAMFIILCAPIMSAIWVRLAKIKKEPSISFKFGLGMLFMSIGFGCLAIGAYNAISSVHSSMIWVVLCYFFQTIGELCLSPMGLSAISKYSPVRLVGLLMGTWFLATAFADYIAGVLAVFTSAHSGTSIRNVAEGYYNLFYHITIVAFIVAVVVFIVNRWLNRLSVLAEKAHHGHGGEEVVEKEAILK